MGFHRLLYISPDFTTMDFESFVELVCSLDEYHSDMHFRSQYCFLYNMKMDYLGHFETFRTDFENMIKHFGLPEELTAIANKKRNNFQKGDRHYTDYYNDKTRRMAAQRYARDIELFGYKFGD